MPRAADAFEDIRKRLAELREEAAARNAAECDCPISIDPSSGRESKVHQAGCPRHAAQVAAFAAVPAHRAPEDDWEALRDAVGFGLAAGLI